MSRAKFTSKKLFEIAMAALAVGVHATEETISSLESVKGLFAPEHDEAFVELGIVPATSEEREKAAKTMQISLIQHGGIEQAAATPERKTKTATKKRKIESHTRKDGKTKNIPKH